jgi:hypothetical protein
MRVERYMGSRQDRARDILQHSLEQLRLAELQLPGRKRKLSSIVNPVERRAEEAAITVAEAELPEQRRILDKAIASYNRCHPEQRIEQRVA